MKTDTALYVSYHIWRSGLLESQASSTVGGIARTCLGPKHLLVFLSELLHTLQAYLKSAKDLKDTSRLASWSPIMYSRVLLASFYSIRADWSLSRMRARLISILLHNYCSAT